MLHVVMVENLTKDDAPKPAVDFQTYKSFAFLDKNDADCIADKMNTNRGHTDDLYSVQGFIPFDEKSEDDDSADDDSESELLLLR